jgi:Zn-dependent protease with chaperone function
MNVKKKISTAFDEIKSIRQKQKNDQINKEQDKTEEFTEEQDTAKTIDYNYFIHPQDKAAQHALQTIPGFDTAVKYYLKLCDEQEMHGINMASKIRLGPNQLPNIYQLLPETCSVLGISEPEFYLEMDPNPNAYTFGDTNPFIVINSGLVELLHQDELKTVIAHECGHILCHHVLYHSMAMTLLNIGTSISCLNATSSAQAIKKIIGGLASQALIPLVWALLYWMRRSELSADRVAAYVMGSSESVIRTMMRLSGGSARITDQVNMKLYEQQIEDYLSLLDESKFNQVLQAWAIKDKSHPLPGIRCHEIRKWFAENSGVLIPATKPTI